MKKYIFFFQKKLDGIYRPLLWSDSWIQVDARRNLLSDSEDIRIREHKTHTNTIPKVIHAKDFSHAFDIAHTISFTI